MLYDNKLDEKGQLNDYILVNESNIFQYSKFSYYHELIKKYKYNGHQNMMIYGDLFVSEYNIIERSFYIQLISAFVLTIIGYIIYMFN